MTDWLPDWKNPAEYPDSRTATTAMWAWEFLRRNASYQRDYETLNQQLTEIGYFEARDIASSFEDNISEDDRTTAKKIIVEANFRSRRYVEKYRILSMDLPNPILSSREVSVHFDVKESASFILYPRDADYEISLPDGSFEVSKLSLGDTDSYEPDRWMNSVAKFSIKNLHDQRFHGESYYNNPVELYCLPLFSLFAIC